MLTMNTTEFPSVTIGEYKEMIRQIGYGGLDNADFDMRHLTSQQVELLTNVLIMAKSWVASKQQGFILTSTTHGVGKTKIGMAMLGLASGSLNPYWDDREWKYSVSVQGKVLDPSFLQNMAGDEYNNILTVIRPNSVILLDDVGREGNLSYTKRDTQSQQMEREARWALVFDHIQKNNVRFIITTNLPSNEAGMTSYFGPATWDRLCGLVHHGYRWVLDLPSYRRLAGGRHI